MKHLKRIFIILLTIFILSLLFIIFTFTAEIENQENKDLRRAIHNNDLVLAKIALSKKARINGHYCIAMDACDISNWLQAVATSSLEMITLLADNGADINEVSIYKTTALLIAVRQKDRKKIEHLIKLGANIENSLQERSILHEVTCGESEEPELLLFLIELGAKVDSLDKEKSTPLFNAVACDRKLSMNVLIAKGANVNHENKFGVNPLALSLYSNLPHLVKILKQKGAHIPDSPDGRLFTGIVLSDQKLVKEAIQIGAKMNEYGFRETKTPLIEAAERGNLEIVKFLIHTGAFVNLESSFGITPLMAASENGHIAIVKVLLETGADLHAQDHWGNTALNRAEHEKQKEIILLLRSK